MSPEQVTVREVTGGERDRVYTEQAPRYDRLGSVRE
jgi:hypothetical protein